jgi:hypothetical protein
MVGRRCYSEAQGGVAVNITDFPVERFKEAQESYEQGWHQVDECLYGFVSQHPDHGEVEYVYAKVCLVNRVYRAYVHLKISESELAKHLSELDWLDGKIRELNGYPNRDLDDESLDKVVACHGSLLEMGREWARADLDSFFSKYLHFHSPKVVPIYDNRAWDTLEEYVPFTGRSIGESYYENFCKRFLKLYKRAIDAKDKEHISGVSVRVLDYYLYLGQER